MNCARWLLIGLTIAALAVSGSPARTAVIADYRGDYLPGTESGQTRVERSADGWDYMWNATGAIGTAAGNYASLKASGTSYNFDGGSPLPRAYPAGWVFLGATGGHPGTGINQGSPAQGADRFAIAAYEVQAGEAGLVQITNGTLGVGSFSSGGVEMRVYVNDTLVTHFVQPGGSTGTGAGVFNVALGQLSTGDKVYVAIGPNAHEGSDSFSLTYRLETVADTASVFWGPGGAGTWDTSTAQWARGVHNPGADVVWNNAENKAAYFTGSGGTVTLGSAITARALSFDAGYTLAGTESLTLTGAGSGGPGAATIQVINSADTVTVSAPIASAAGLAKIGPGTLALTGTTSITSGGLSTAGGTLRLEGSSNTAVAGSVVVGRNTVSGGGDGTLVIGDNASLTASSMHLGDRSGITDTSRPGGTVSQSGGTVTISGPVRIGHYAYQTSTYTLSNGTLSLTGTPAGPVNPSGVGEQPGILYVGIDGTGNFTQTGGAASAHGIVLDGRSETAGSDTFTLNGGTFTVGSSGIKSGSYDANLSYQINLGGGTLRAGDSWGSALNMTLTGTGGNTTIDTNGHTIELSGELSGPGGLVRSGPGTLVLSGANIYTGETRINSGGVLSVGDVADSGSPSNLGSSGSLLFAGGVLKFTGAGADATNRNVSISGGANIDVSNANGNLTLTSPIAGSGQRLSKIGPGTLTLDVASGTTALGTLDAAGGNLVLAGDTVVTVSGTTRVAVSPGSLSGLPDTQPGDGTLTIQDNVSLTTSSMAMGENNSPRVVGMVGTVNQTGGTVTVTGSARFGHWPQETSTYNLSGGVFRLTGTPTGVVNPPGVGEQPGILYLGVDGTGHFHQTGGTASAHGIVLDARGDTAGDESFTLEGGAFTVGPSGITSGNLDANTTYQINFGGGTLSASADWSSTRLMTLTGAGGDATVDTNGHTINLSGILSGSGGLIKAGEGTLVLGADSSYGGDTNVGAGTLLVNGSLHADSAVTIQSGGTLGGTGTIGGPASILAGGTLATGASVGTLTFGSDLTLAGGAVWDWEFIEGTPGNYDQAVGTGGAALILPTDTTTPITLNILGDAGGHWVKWYDEFTIFDGAVENFDAGLFDLVNHSDWAHGWQIFSNGQNLVLTAVPEPGTLVLLTFGLLALLPRRRKRQ